MNQIVLSDFALTRVFFAFVLLLASAHGSGYFFQRFLKIPKVIGEIFGGLLLGPTCLGFFFPSAYQWIFHAFPSEGQIIATVYWIGLVLLMFISGFEVQKSLSKGDKKLISFIFLGATIIPFLVGWFIPYFFDFSPYLGAKGNMFSLTLIIAIAIAVTSIPVISKIFIDLGIANTRFAKIVLATATIEDVLLWVALAVATGASGGEQLSFASIILKVATTLAFFMLVLFALPKIFELMNKSRLNFLIKSSATGYVLFMCFFFSAIASILHVNVIFGAFLSGIAVSRMTHAKIATVKVHIQEMSLGFFIPVYFATVGLKLDLIHHFDFPFFLAFLLLAVVVKMFGTVIAAKLAGQNWLSSFNFGAAMNTRGGPGIVLATIAFELGIINEAFFTVLVLLAIVTSLMGGYWFRFVLSKGWELMGKT